MTPVLTFTSPLPLPRLRSAHPLNLSHHIPPRLLTSATLQPSRRVVLHHFLLAAPALLFAQRADAMPLEEARAVTASLPTAVERAVAQAELHDFVGERATFRAAGLGAFRAAGSSLVRYSSTNSSNPLAGSAFKSAVKALEDADSSALRASRGLASEEDAVRLAKVMSDAVLKFVDTVEGV